MAMRTECGCTFGGRFASGRSALLALEGAAASGFFVVLTFGAASCAIVFAGSKRAIPKVRDKAENLTNLVIFMFRLVAVLLMLSIGLVRNDGCHYSFVSWGEKSNVRIRFHIPPMVDVLILEIQFFHGTGFRFLDSSGGSFQQITC